MFGKKINIAAKAIVEKRFFKTLNAGLKRRSKVTRKKLSAWTSKTFVNYVMRPHYSIDPNLIFFTNFSGEYECNPGYICKELDRRENDYKLVFVVWPKGKKATKFPGQFPESVITVERFSYEYYKILCQAKMIIDNGTSFVASNYKKKRDQILISTWHGSLGIKRFCKDDTEANKRYNKKAQRGADEVDYMISNSLFENFYFRDTYWPRTPIMMLGHARNDILFKDPLSSEMVELKRHICKIYKIPLSTKLCLYAPTFRDVVRPVPGHNPYMIDYEKLRASLMLRFGGDWMILTKFHFRTKFFMKGKLPPYVVNVSTYPDIQELLAVVDVGITDYSSWICEFVHTRKPGFLYATDLEDYDSERGFYDPMDSMPFPLAENDEELSERIIKFDLEKYVADCDAFISKKGCVDDGNAASRACDQIDLLMKGEPVSCKLYTGTADEFELYRPYEI